MTNRLKIYILSTLFLITSIECQKETGLGESYVDKALQVHFDAFVHEANMRGLTIDFDKTPVSGFLSDDLEEGISAQCQHDSQNPNRLLVSRSRWIVSTPMEREFLVFHELGHCYLKRSHLDTKDGRGYCLSIMHSSSSACYNNYSEKTRAQYLDEYFDATIR